MSKKATKSGSTGSAKAPARRGWLGLAVGGVACLGAVVYVTAQGLGGPAPTGRGGDAAASGSSPGSGGLRAPDPSEVAAMAHMTGKEIPAEVQTMLEGSAPAHLEYDAANNRHWWAPHNHWHDGPPPADVGMAANLPAGATPIEAPFDMNAPAIMPDGTAPEPWEYDPTNNRHWHAGHGHWHQGPPPPEDQRE